MTPEEIYDVWAPPESPWSDWVKPLLFAHLDRINVRFVQEAYMNWSDSAHRIPPPPPGGEPYAVVVDLPGEESVIVGAQLARAGYRPVPLYNSAPGGPTPLVDAESVLVRLVAFTRTLWDLRLPADAPPVFLLDSTRRGGRIAPLPGCFDNRSFCFVTDLPSGNFLQSRGIRHALLIHRGMQSMVSRGIQPADDLAHALYRWQESGIEIVTATPGEDRAHVPCRVARPTGLRSMLWRLLKLVSLRRHTLGGFGAIIPEPSSGGGGIG